MLTEVMGVNPATPEEEETIEQRRRNCGICGGVNCVEKDEGHIYHNVEIDLKLTVPAHICSRCDSVVYEPDDYKNLLEAEEAAQGRSYVRVEIKNGRISKYSLH